MCSFFTTFWIFCWCKFCMFLVYFWLLLLYWFIILFLAWLWNWSISAELVLVLSHTEKACIVAYYGQFSTNIKNYNSFYQFCYSRLLPLGLTKLVLRDVTMDVKSIHINNDNKRNSHIKWLKSLVWSLLVCNLPIKILKKYPKLLSP